MEVVLRARFASLVAVALAGCSPVYIPGAANFSMLEDKGDVHLQALGGTNGGQVDVGWAAADHLALRATAQGMVDRNQDSTNGSYYNLALGFGWWGAWPTGAGTGEDAQGLRLGISLDVGGGMGDGSSTVTVGGTASTLRYVGPLLTMKPQVDFGWESPYFAAGLAVRPIYVRFWNSPESDGQGTADVFQVEPLLMVRAGAPNVKVELQGGAWLPIVEAPSDASFGIPFPVIMTVGVSADF